MSAFQLTPNGIVRLDAGADGNQTRTLIAESQPESQRPASASSASQVAIATPTPAKLASKVERRNWVKELRARLKVVEREIKQLRKLEDERDEIKKLIAAAQRPLAEVRNISARK